MAKSKRRGRTTETGDNKALRIIAGIVLLAIILALSITIAVAYARAKAETYTPRTFYVEVAGKRYYDDGDIKLEQQSLTTFKCGNVGNSDNTNKLYTVKITSTSTDETAFTYTLNGATRLFLDGEDYTKYFDITRNADGFEIANVKDTPATILQRRYPDKKVIAPETDQDISYFTLTVTNADNTASISFALTFEDIKIILDPEGGVIL